MTQHVEYPESLVKGVSRFGGFLSVLQGMMFLMYWINKREFEKKVSEFLQKQKRLPELLEDSTAPESSSRARDIEERKTYIAEE